MEILKENGEDGRAKMDDISSLIDTAMIEIKEISYKLKPRILDDFGLVPSLKQLCSEVSARSGIKGMFQAVKFNGRLDSGLETGLYRIAQEALNNIVKHSHAAEFSLQLVKHPSILRMMVEDDGVGFDSDNIREDKAKQNCMGLVNMSERVHSFNGRLTVDSQKGRGTEIIVEIPLGDEYEQN
jgi:two-component system sensor histidine kinase DegS